MCVYISLYRYVVTRGSSVVALLVLGRTAAHGVLLHFYSLMPYPKKSRPAATPSHTKPGDFASHALLGDGMCSLRVSSTIRMFPVTLGKEFAFSVCGDC